MTTDNHNYTENNYFFNPWFWLLIALVILLLVFNQSCTEPIDPQPECSVLGSWQTTNLWGQKDTILFKGGYLYRNGTAVDYWSYEYTTKEGYPYLKIKYEGGQSDDGHVVERFEQFVDFGPDCNSFRFTQYEYYPRTDINIFYHNTSWEKIH